VIAPILRSHRVEPWGLDLTQCEYIGPFATAIIAALWQDARAAGVPPGIGLPVQPPQLLAYLWFSGLERLLRNGRVPQTAHPDCETLPLRFVSRAAFNDPDELIALVTRHHELSADSEELLRTCVNETLQNVDDHAASKIGGVYTARFLTQRHAVRAAVVDAGAGIATTLRRKFPSLASDDEALRAVLEGGYTSKSTPRNLGVGISTMARIVSGCGGSFLLLSGTALREVAPGGRASGRDFLSPGFPGTAVFFTFPELHPDDERHERSDA
jgi:anti-sigma regulatory factor (Ser/Thr protein kinase)